MNNRQDALLAAAKFIEAVNKGCDQHARPPGRNRGQDQALPGAPNVIPGKVILSLELRDLDAARSKCSIRRFELKRIRLAKASKVKFDFKRST